MLSSENLWAKLKPGRSGESIKATCFFRVKFEPGNCDGRIWVHPDGKFYTDDIILFYMDNGYFQPYRNFVGRFEDATLPELIRETVLHNPDEIRSKGQLRKRISKREALKKAHVRGKARAKAYKRRAAILSLLSKKVLTTNQLMDGLDAQGLFGEEGRQQPSNLLAVHRDLKILRKELDIDFVLQKNIRHWFANSLEGNALESMAEKVVES